MKMINFNLDNLVRDNIRKLKPYQSARGIIANSEAIFMDANENPFPSEYNRYPDPFQTKLKTAIGRNKKINPNNIFIGNGSDEIIDLLIRAFCNPGEDSILINIPTYGMYKVCAEINDVGITEVELDKNFQLDTAQILEKAQDSKLIFICSPNNPTGNIMDREKIYRILENFNGIVVIDEAYIDFAEENSFQTELNNYPNLVVLQTFSKALGMAGIRLGMGFMNEQIVQILNKIKPPYNISTLNQNAALKAIKESNFTLKSILDQKNWLIKELFKLDFIQKIWPSETNFLLVQMENAKEIYQFLKSKGVIIRDRSNEINCANCLRITVGNSLDNTMLITLLKQFQPTKIKSYEKNIISG